MRQRRGELNTAYPSTPGTNGIGYQSILQLAQHNPAHIAFTGRNQSAADKLIAQTGLGGRASFIPCDMTSLASVKAATQTFLDRHERLDVLIECAGVMEVGGKASLTQDGYERAFGINYLAHAAMDCKLLPLMERTASSGADVRVVIVSSDLHRSAPPAGIDFANLRDAAANGGIAGSQRRYGQSKLANVLRADEIARRYPSIAAVSVHPGVVATDLHKDFPWYAKLATRITQTLLTPEQGAYTQVWAATAPRAGVQSGVYYCPVGERGNRSAAATKGNADKLWKWTEEVLAKWD